jgi:hypothetical protein
LVADFLVDALEQRLHRVAPRTDVRVRVNSLGGKAVNKKDTILLLNVFGRNSNTQSYLGDDFLLNGFDTLKDE